MFLWLESTLSFSRKKTRSTPYSCKVENFTQEPSGPAMLFSITRFFLPRTYWLPSKLLDDLFGGRAEQGQALLTPSSSCRMSLRAFTAISAVEKEV